MLDRVVRQPSLHARMLNTFARLEYVGVRKMLKSRRAEFLNLEGLEHILDETVHTLRLKRAAHAAARGATTVDTFRDADTLAGDEAETYFQGVDRAAQTTLLGASDDVRAESNYLLTSAAIEIRAGAFYPVYEDALRAAGSVRDASAMALILRDETKHLADMATSLERVLPEWRMHLEEVLSQEHDLFTTFIGAVEQTIQSAERAWQQKTTVQMKPIT
jgi:hypothetical protein